MKAEWLGQAADGMAAKPASPRALLGAEAVQVVRGSRQLLAATTLSFARGCVTGIVGHNGSGKTTLLKCLARQIPPHSGQVTLGGRPVSAWAARPFAREVAYLPQQLPASTGLLGRELVAMGRYPWHGPLGRMGPEGHAAVAEAIALAEIEDFADRSIDTLSGGERQRVWIAMLIAQQTGYMLLDEPLAALDLSHQVEVMGLLRRLAEKRDAGIVLVVHDINIAARFCDHLVALRGGHVMAGGSPAALMREDVLESIFGLPMRVLEGAGAPVAVPA